MTSSIHNKAGFIGIRSSLIGSFLFSIVEKFNNAMDPASVSFGSIDYNYLLRWLVVDFIIGFILSVFPGYFGGRILNNVKMRFSLFLLMIFGACIGIAAVILISLQIYLSFYRLIIGGAFNNNPAVPVYFIRLTEASIIAALMGAWSGYQISKFNLPSENTETIEEPS